MKTGELTVINQQGVTIRTAPNTGAGSIRLARAGTVLEYQSIIELSGGDKWALLTSIDPEKAFPWHYGTSETVAFVAVYVKGVEYCKVHPDEKEGTFADGWNACLVSMGDLLPSLRK